MSSNATIVPSNDKTGFPPIVKYIYLVYYVVIFLTSTIGNLFAILTCYKNFKQSAAVLLAFVASLAVADLIFTLLTPVDLAVFVAGSWVTGGFMCRAQSFFIETSYTASILTLTAISHERLKAVSTPLLARSQRVFQRKLIPIFIWVVSIIVCSPLLYAYAIYNEDGQHQCLNIAWGHNGRQIYYTIQGILLFALPLAYMVYAHYKIFKILKKHSLTRSRIASKNTVSNETASQKKVGKMLVVVTCIFVACYFPFVVIRSLRYFYVFNHNLIWRFVQLMIFTQAAVNPVIYCFYNRQFRVVFKDLLKCKWNTIRHRPETSQTGKARGSSVNVPSTSVQLDEFPAEMKEKENGDVDKSIEKNGEPDKSIVTEKENGGPDDSIETNRV